MKLRQLEALLEDVEPFEAPKVALEQYATGARAVAARGPRRAATVPHVLTAALRCAPVSGSHIAARILHVAHGLGDVEDRSVVDLGCGCGMLSIAAVLMGAGHVVRRAAPRRPPAPPER